MTDGKTSSRVVLITAPVEEDWMQQLRSQWPELRFELRPARAKAAIADELWREIEVLYTSFTTPLPTPEQAPGITLGAALLGRCGLYYPPPAFSYRGDIYHDERYPRHPHS